MFCLATCIHPPGAAHKSIKTRDLCRKLNFRFNWINLKAARDRYPTIKYIYEAFLSTQHNLIKITYEYDETSKHTFNMLT